MDMAPDEISREWHRMTVEAPHLWKPASDIMNEHQTNKNDDAAALYALQQVGWLSTSSITPVTDAGADEYDEIIIAQDMMGVRHD